MEAADIQAFLVELLGGQVTVRHEPLTATWEVKVGGWQASSSAATAEWGTSRITAYELVQLACNGGAPVVYDEVERPDGSTTRVRNVPETMLAEAKLQALNERFREWLWEDPERTDRLVEVYNRRYNATVLRRFDGSHLTFPGWPSGSGPMAPSATSPTGSRPPRRPCAGSPSVAARPRRCSCRR